MIERTGTYGQRPITYLTSTYCAHAVTCCVAASYHDGPVLAHKRCEPASVLGSDIRVRGAAVPVPVEGLAGSEMKRTRNAVSGEEAASSETVLNPSRLSAPGKHRIIFQKKRKRNPGLRALTTWASAVALRGLSGWITPRRCLWPVAGDIVAYRGL